MSISEWFHHLFNPHCEHCNICENCEYLKLQVEKLELKNEQLLQKLLHPNEPEVKIEVKPPEPLRPRHIPWRARRQMLEQEDARAAQIMRQREKEINAEVAPPDDPDVKALEKEMGLIEKERENASEVS